ncbi:chaperone NapD [Azospirillum brasilense]|uniref:Chaperone NapD n=1 Tax=Azospirillum brasilense TaxID=192 RepID=A0A235H8G4_AZOBR|nr:chaperone NapD [Azospirillum brasilense]OYD82056.1 nitrate reductase [Azospirillum brasilense]
MPELHISSLVIQHAPDRTAALKEVVCALDGADWHASENGKAIVTLETATEAEVLDRIADINAIAGVHTTTLVYHHYEDAERCAEPMPADTALVPHAH